MGIKPMRNLKSATPGCERQTPHLMQTCSARPSEMATRVLAAFKSDPTAFLAFYKYAINHMVLDSLNFLLDVYEYKGIPPFLRPSKEEQIVHKYIQPSSKQCVNITHRIRDTILEKQGSAHHSVFDKAAESCNTLLEAEVLADFKANYKSQQHPIVLLKGKVLRASLSSVVHKDMVGPCIFLLTGRRSKKEDLKKPAPPLALEHALKKWIFEGDNIFPVLWHPMEKDLDFVVLSSTISLFSPNPPKLQEFLLYIIVAGLEEAKAEDSHLIPELAVAECVLKEYLFKIGKNWWAKVLKKVIESIYKEEIQVVGETEEGATTPGRDKILGFISNIITNIILEPKVPAGLRFVLKTAYIETVKRFPTLEDEKFTLAATKIIIDACCTLLCHPDKAPFDVSIKDAIINRSTAFFVCEGLKGLFETTVSDPGRPSEIRSISLETKAKFSPQFEAWILNQLNVQSDIKPTQPTNKQETDISILGHYLISNATTLIESFSISEMGFLVCFLESNCGETISIGDT